MNRRLGRKGAACFTVSQSLLPLRHLRHRRLPRRTFSTLLLAGVGLLAGCSPFEVVPSDAGQAASLIATPIKTPGTAGCTLKQTPVQTQDLPGEDDATRLAVSLNRVRHEKFFGDFALSVPPTPSAEFDEAWRLVELAKGVSIGEPASPVEKQLINLLPWAADIGATPAPNSDEGNLVTSIVQDARDYVGKISGKENDKPDPLNTLLPPAAAPAGTVAVAGGSSLPVKSLNTQDPSLFQKLSDLASFRAFHLLALFSAAHVNAILTDRNIDPTKDPGKLDAEVRIFNVARYLSAYFDAYFRGGQFVQVSINDDAFLNTLSTRLAGRLQTTGMSASQIKPVLQDEISQWCEGAQGDSVACGGLKQGSTAFVSRAGLTVQFSGVSFALGSGVSHTYPQPGQFGPQLIRVFVEAIFDANGEHAPGMPSSTACQSKAMLFAPEECVAAGGKPSQTITQIDMLSSAAEALTQTGTGALIRGANIASLNNEAVAQMLETLAGVNARKITEKVLYIASNGVASDGTSTCPLTTVSITVKPTTKSTATPSSASPPSNVAPTKDNQVSLN